MIRYSIETYYDKAALLPFIRQLYPNISDDIAHARLDVIRQSGNYQMAFMHKNEQLIGICGLWSGTKLWCGKYLELDNFVIDAAYRGRGLSHGFLNYVIGYAETQQYDAIALDVFQHNERANALYDKAGFTTPGHHRMLWLNDSAYYGDKTNLSL